MTRFLEHPRDLLRLAIVKLHARGEPLQAGAELDFAPERAEVQGDASATTRLNSLLDRASAHYRWVQASPAANSGTYLLTELGEQEARVLEDFGKAMASAATHYGLKLDAASRTFARQFMNEQEELGRRGMSQSSGARASAQRTLDDELERRRQSAEDLVISLGLRLCRPPEEAEYEQLYELAVTLVRAAVDSLEPIRAAFNGRHSQYPQYQVAPLAEGAAVEATRAAINVAAFPHESDPTPLQSTHNNVSVGGSVGAVVQGSGSQVHVDMTVDNRRIHENLSAVLEAISALLPVSPEIAEIHAELAEASQLDRATPLPKKLLIRSYRALAGLLAIAADASTLVEGAPKALTLVKAGLALLGVPVG